MTVLEQLRQRREEILRIGLSHGAGNIRVFGSVARQEETESSDVDLLVETVGEVSSWFPAGLILDLQSLIGRKIDIVTERGLSPYLRKTVLEEALEL